MKRFAIALIGGAAVSTLVYASASALTVDSETIQYGQGTTTCDADGVTVGNWGLETGDNTVRSVKIKGIDADCAGADLFVRFGDVSATNNATRVPIPAAAGTDIEVQVSFPGPSFRTPKSIGDVNVWIEG